MALDRISVWKELVSLTRERQQGRALAGEAVTFRSMRRFVLLGVLFVGLALIGRFASLRSVHAPVEARSSVATEPSGEGRGAEGGAERSGTTADRDKRLVFSPGVDLEREETAMVSRAKAKLDVAMYSFTDMELARRLAALEARGVKIRVYRDGAEYRKEERSGRPTTTALLRKAGVEVKVKAGDELMHLKSYAVDGDFLRSGSANWSIGGLRYQDNDALYVRSPVAVAGFEAEFDDMWDRSDNIVVP